MPVNSTHLYTYLTVGCQLEMYVYLCIPISLHRFAEVHSFLQFSRVDFSRTFFSTFKFFYFTCTKKKLNLHCTLNARSAIRKKATNNPVYAKNNEDYCLCDFHAKKKRRKKRNLQCWPHQWVAGIGWSINSRCHVQSLSARNQLFIWQGRKSEMAMCVWCVCAPCRCLDGYFETTNFSRLGTSFRLSSQVDSTKARRNATARKCVDFHDEFN